MENMCDCVHCNYQFSTIIPQTLTHTLKPQRNTNYKSKQALIDASRI